MMKECKLTQQALSDKLVNMGVSAKLDTIKSWFRKNPKTRHSPQLVAIRAMAEIFGVTIDSLISKHSCDDIFVATRVKNIKAKNLHIVGGLSSGEISAYKNKNFNETKAFNDKNSPSLLKQLEYQIKENLIKECEFLSSDTLPKTLQTPTAHYFLKLFAEFGNDTLLLPTIDKLEKIKKISEE